jgi:O-antigen/teichoic acid export membrane protein
MFGRLRGFSFIIAATGIAGIAGYVVTWLVYREIGPAAYAAFAVFWATLYLVVGGLSGIQQEIARATHEIKYGSASVANKARVFGVGLAVLVSVALVATAPLWADAVFPGVGWLLVWPLAVGAGAYVLVATLSGSLYGLSRWRSLAVVIASDAVVRLALFGVGLALTDDVVVLAWLVALPFPLVLLAVWPMIRSGFVGRTAIDVGYRGLAWNVSRTVLASVSAAILVSGFPLLLGVTSDGVDEALLGELIFTVTLARAPLIVSAMALQSYFIVRFKQGGTATTNLVFRVVGGILSLAVPLAVLGLFVGPTVMRWVSGDEPTFGGGVIAILVGSSALIAALSVTGAAILARGNHFVYSTGWVLAAITTVGIMVLPLDFMTRVLAAILIAPIVGLVTQVAWLLIVRRHRAEGVSV